MLALEAEDPHDIVRVEPHALEVRSDPKGEEILHERRNEDDDPGEERDPVEGGDDAHEPAALIPVDGEPDDAVKHVDEFRKVRPPDFLRLQRPRSIDGGAEVTRGELVVLVRAGSADLPFDTGESRKGAALIPVQATRSPVRMAALIEVSDASTWSSHRRGVACRSRWNARPSSTERRRLVSPADRRGAGDT